MQTAEDLLNAISSHSETFYVHIVAPFSSTVQGDLLCPISNKCARVYYQIDNNEMPLDLLVNFRLIVETDNDRKLYTTAEVFLYPCRMCAGHQIFTGDHGLIRRIQ